jgi:hypothetical protein
MIAFFLDLPWYVQAFVIAYVLFCLAIIGVALWAWLFPLDPDQLCKPDCQAECCAEADGLPNFKEFRHE